MIQPSLVGPLLLAQIDKWEQMGRDFRTDHTKLDPSLIVASIVTLLVVIVFLWGLSRLLNRQEGRRLFNSPKQLFRSLCRAHELSRAQCRLLLQIARSQGATQPASLFLEPELLESAARQPQFKSQQEAFRQLRARLFSDLSPPAVRVPEEFAAAKPPAVASAPSINAEPAATARGIARPPKGGAPTVGVSPVGGAASSAAPS